MNIAKKIKKNIKKQSTYKYEIQDTDQDFKCDFAYIQIRLKAIYNIVLKYLYDKFGVSKLDKFYPTLANSSNAFYTLERKIVKYVKRYYCNDRHYIDNIIYDRQSVDLFIEQIMRNFAGYRTKQRQVKYWSAKKQKEYLENHNCNLTGYGRLTFQHEWDHFKTILFAQNGTKAIYCDNDRHHVKIPHFGHLQVKENTDQIRDKKIIAAKVKQKGSKYVLQISVQKKVKRHFTKAMLKQAVGGDINTAKDEFFIFSDGFQITWNKNVKKRFLKWNKISKKAQAYIKHHQHDNSSLLAEMKKRKAHADHKKQQIMIDWYRQDVVPVIVKRYPLLVMERLNGMGFRISKYKKNIVKKMRKNINKKFNDVLKPNMFLNILADAYQAAGQTLILVDPTDTSKTCHHCNYVYHDLQVGQKVWICPKCGEVNLRDLNACLNIRDWGINPDKHIVVITNTWKEHPWMKKDDLITIF